MPTEKAVQSFVHNLEEGGWSDVIRTALMVALFLAASAYIMVSQFNGLSNADGMDQAQVARELARGNGFSTKFVRPLVYAQMKEKMGGFPEGPLPDTYNAPLNPAINSLALRFMKDTWDMPTSQLVYPSDRVIAILGLLWFGLGAWISFFTLRRLFDQKLAVLATGLTLVSSAFWEASQTGLPQPLMFFLMSIAAYLMVRAVESRVAGRPSAGWLALAGLVFGLLVLANGVALWIFLGAFAFAVIAFTPRGRDAGAMLVAFLVVVSPWMFRNYTVSGIPFGTSMYTVLFQVKGDVPTIMRDEATIITELSMSALRRKIQNGILADFGSIYSRFGNVLVAPVFFLALLHQFKRREVSLFRWCALLMWGSALFGMAFVGRDAGDVGVNDLHILFIPIMSAYGLAFVLVLWNRLNLRIQLARATLITVIFLISAAPFIIMLMGTPFVVRWPPYAPPYIAIMNDWVTDDEIIASDMPWAVAWYADRTSLWMSQTPKGMVEMNDWGDLHKPIVGLYLTPISGDSRFLSDIVKGQWKDWTSLVMHSGSVPPGFPLKFMIPLPFNNLCIFYADRDRWKLEEEK